MALHTSPDRVCRVWGGCAGCVDVHVSYWCCGWCPVCWRRSFSFPGSVLTVCRMGVPDRCAAWMCCMNVLSVCAVCVCRMDVPWECAVWMCLLSVLDVPFGCDVWVCCMDIPSRCAVWVSCVFCVFLCVISWIPVAPVAQPFAPKHSSSSFLSL